MKGGAIIKMYAELIEAERLLASHAAVFETFGLEGLGRWTEASSIGGEGCFLGDGLRCLRTELGAEGRKEGVVATRDLGPVICRTASAPMAARYSAASDVSALRQFRRR
jgi:hypothetical protein